MGPENIRPLKVEAGWYAEAPSGFVGRMRTSLQTVVNRTTIPAPLLEHIINVNHGAIAYTVTTLIMLVDSLYDRGFRRVANCLAYWPLTEQIHRGIDTIEMVARNGLHLLEDGGARAEPNYQHTLVGRYKTILGRDLHPHDVDEELAARSKVTVPHHYATCTEASCDSWHSHLYRQLQQFSEAALASAPNTPQTLKQWWEARAVWLGGGSSSTKIRDTPLSAVLADTKGIRSTKNLTISTKPTKYIYQVFDSKPQITCRQATKNEPGFKRRPLRASDDDSYLIASFASSNMEKYLSQDGCVMRQRPEDVRQSQISIEHKAPNKMILCIDYSDFNNTHTQRSRSLANLALAKNYLKAGQPTQAAAALWMAKAHLNHWLNETRCFQGLSSGERDTARDNTMLHAMYSKLARREVEERLHEKVNWDRIQMCGDDEIIIGVKWSVAMIYSEAIKNQGHKLQRRKMMMSTECGEFLQYNMRACRLPKQPLPPALNNYVSGSWYKSSNYSEAAYPLQVAEAGSSCVRRGARAQLMADCAAATCNWLCGSTRWRQALCATNAHWASVQMPKSVVTRKESIADQLRPSIFPAHSDYIGGLAKAYQLSDAEIKVCSEYTMNNITATLAADLRTESTRLEEEKDDVDKQNAICATEAISSSKEQELVLAWLRGSQHERYDVNTWLAVQLGLPLPLIKNIGLSKIVMRASNQKRKHINLPGQDRQQLITHMEYAALPGACAPYFITN